MPILHSYYQDVYRCPIVQLLGMGKSKRPLCVFAGRHIYG